MIHVYTIQKQNEQRLNHKNVTETSVQIEFSCARVRFRLNSEHNNAFHSFPLN